MEVARNENGYKCNAIVLKVIYNISGNRPGPNLARIEQVGFTNFNKVMKATDHVMGLPFSRSIETLYMGSKTRVVAQDENIEATITFQKQFKSIVAVSITALNIIDESTGSRPGPNLARIEKVGFTNFYNVMKATNAETRVTFKTSMLNFQNKTENTRPGPILAED